MNNFKLPSFELAISRNYLNILKWFALIAMMVFHFSTALQYYQPEYIVLLGRLSFPIFGFIVGYNLASASVNGTVGVESRMIRLLLVFGCFAQPFFWSFSNSPLPLNIMFSLALGVFMVLRYKDKSAWFVFFILAIFVDYAWAGVLLVLISYLMCRQALSGRLSSEYLLAFITSLAFVSWTVQSYYPMMALILFWIGTLWTPAIKLPRCKWAFYILYPLHLAIIQVLHQFHINLM